MNTKNSRHLLFSLLCINILQKVKSKECKMYKISSVFMVFALALLAFSLSAQEVNVTGDWELTLTTPRGESTQPINFKQEGEKLTVTTTARDGSEIKGEGTVKEKAIEWTITRTTQRGEFKQTFKGTVEGDAMSGTVQMGDFGSFDWTAKKKK